MHTPCGREAGTAEPFAPAPRRLQAREPNGMRKRREVGQHTSSVRSTSIPRQLRVAERVHAPRLALARILGVIYGGGWSGASSSSDAPSSSPSSSLRHSNPVLHPRIRPVLRQEPDEGLIGFPETLLDQCHLIGDELGGFLERTALFSPGRRHGCEDIDQGWNLGAQMVVGRCNSLSLTRGYKIKSMKSISSLNISSSQ